MTRRPRSYVGQDHETIGSDIVSVLKALHAPEATLGRELSAHLAAVKPDQWYPIATLLEPLEVLDQKLGTFALRNVGWELFKLSHAEAVRAAVKSARQLLYGFDDVYKRANRGTDIGGWKVLSFTPGRAEMDKTTPHHCVMEEGIVEEALRTIGVRADVSQRQCFRKGAESCIYVVTSKIVDERWG